MRAICSNARSKAPTHAMLGSRTYSFSLDAPVTLICLHFSSQFLYVLVFILMSCFLVPTLLHFGPRFHAVSCLEARFSIFLHKNIKFNQTTPGLEDLPIYSNLNTYDL